MMVTVKMMERVTPASLEVLAIEEVDVVVEEAALVTPSSAREGRVAAIRVGAEEAVVAGSASMRVPVVWVAAA